MQARATSATPPPDEPKRPSTALLTLAVVAFVGVIGVFAYVRSAHSQPDAAAPPETESAAATQTPVEPPYAKFGPHKQANLPPLPFQAYAPPRPPEVVRAAYLFAAEHPEVLSYVPSFCGCERAGHRGNEDCFVAKRDASGDVTEWEPHGLDCTVCLDVASDARQMYASGASVRDIRAAIEREFVPTASTMTPTPKPPSPKPPAN